MNPIKSLFFPLLSANFFFKMMNFSLFSRIIRAEVRNVQKLNQLGSKSACLDVAGHASTNKSSASNSSLIFPTTSINNTSNPFFLPHCSPNYYFNQSTPFYFLRQQNQPFASSPAQNAASTPASQPAYESSQLNQTPPSNENYYPSSMFNQEPLLNSNSSATTAHQLNSPNASFQISSPNHSSSSYLHEEPPISLGQTYTAYNSLSNSHHHSNAHHHHHHASSAVLNSYYSSTNNAFQSNELTNSRLMNNFISDNYSVNSLVSKNSSVYSSNSATASHLNHFKQNASQKAGGLMPKLGGHPTHDAYPAGINQTEQSGYVVKKATVYNNLSNLNNFNNLNTFNNNLDTTTRHNLDLIKNSINSINYFSEQQYHQCNENNAGDIKPKLASIYGDINGIRNPLLFGLAKNCSSQAENNSSNELSPVALAQELANYTPNKLIHSLNSTGSTCSTMSSPTLSN